MIEANSDEKLGQIDRSQDFIKRTFPKLDAWDAKLEKSIYHKYTGSKVRKGAKMVSFLGDPRLWGPTFLIMGIVGITQLDFSLLIIFGSGFFQSFAIYFILKKVVKRSRPFVQYDDIIRLDKTGHGYSFPSGHCHHSTILIGLIGLVFLPYAWFYIIIVVYNIMIAYSRLVSGCHFPSDTIIGTLEAYLELIFFWFLTKYLFLQIYEGIMTFLF